MSRRGFWRAACVASLLVAAVARAETAPEAPRAASAPIDGVVSQPPGTAYRHLVMLEWLSEGADPTLVQHLLDPDAAAAGAGTRRDVGQLLDGAANPVVQIVDRESMLHGVGQMLGFGLTGRSRIQAARKELEAKHPAIVEQIDRMLLYEEVILLRLSIVDAMEASSRDGVAQLVAAYQAGTHRIRNDMETEQLELELAALTQTASEDLSARHAALGRLIGDSGNHLGVEEAQARLARMNDSARNQAAIQSANRMFQGIMFQFGGFGFSVAP